MVVLACVDTVRVYGFRPKCPARGCNEVLVATLYLSLPFLLEISITITCQLAVPELVPPSHEDDQ